MNKRPDISIVILTYNTCDLTIRCLESLDKTAWGSLSKETIVVDNASSDKTPERVKKLFPHAYFIKNSNNFGFAKGNNVGIRKARGRYILLLNSDTEVSARAIPTMIAFMDSHQKAGASTCKLVLSDGSIDPACHRGFPTPWNAFSYYTKLEKLFPRTHVFGGYHEGYKNMNIPHEVDAISGAFFMIRRETVQDVGVLDESFFMYAEDIDWSYRMKHEGWQIWFVPTATVLHRKKQSGRAHLLKDRRLKSNEYFLISNRFFYTKHYGKKYSPAITFLVYAFYDIQLFLLKVLGDVV